MISSPQGLFKMSQYYKPSMCMSYSIATITKSFRFNLQDTLKLVYPYLDTDTFGVRLRKILIRNNVSIESLSKLLKITSSGVRNYTNEAAYPTPKIILTLYSLFDKRIICDEYIEFICSGSSNRLKTWREKNKLTKKAASKILGVGENAYLSWENNKTYVSKRTFYEIKNKIV